MASTPVRFEVPHFTAEEVEEQRRAVEEYEHHQLQAVIQDRIRKSCIPACFTRVSITDDRIREWCEDPGYGLIIQGKQGRMKTGNACAALRKLAETGTVLFATFDDLKRDVKACFASNESERSVVNRYAFVGALCLDDLGNSQMTDWSLPILFEVIKKREENVRPTIITTNYTGDQLLDWMTVGGDDTTAKTIISRMTRFKRVELLGADRRRA